MKTSVKHQVAYDSVLALVKSQVPGISAVELLAIAANLVGKLIAMQDQRAVSVEMALKIVSENVEMGNAQMYKELIRTKGLVN